MFHQHLYHLKLKNQNLLQKVKKVKKIKNLKNINTEH
jgi:hypothetical protein